MEQSGINALFREQHEKGLPCVAKVGDQYQMLMARLDGRRRSSAAEPLVADRYVLPSHRRRQFAMEPAQHRDFQPALERDDRFELKRARRAFFGNRGQMRGAVKMVQPDFSSVPRGMTTEVPQVAARDSSHQVEIDDRLVFL